jgi:hypothetical protein
MAAQQNQGCAICGCKCSTYSRLSVDHCHTTGKVRGLLCQKCNSAIGYMEDNTDRLLSAVNYLRKAEGWEPLTPKKSDTPISLSHEVEWCPDPNIVDYEISVHAE